MQNLDDLAVATGGDPLMLWAAGRPGTRIWVEPGAAVVASPGLSRRDRLAIHGEPEAVAGLLGRVLPEVGPSYRPLGVESLVVAVGERRPELVLTGRFGWMDTTTAPAEGAGEWLDESEWPRVSALLDGAFPDSYAKPGVDGVRRWAGLRDADGTLTAVAADAWSTPRIGLIGGVATRTDRRGRGLAATICAFVTSELLVGRDRVALLVDHWNVAAVSTYRKLGFDLTPLAAAHQVTR